MKRFLVITAFFAILLAGCTEVSKHDAHQHADKKLISNNAQELIKEENKIPTNLNEWESVLHNSDWYKEVAGTGEVLFERFLDFKGDGINEVIIGTMFREPDKENEVVYFVGEYDGQQKQWSTLYKELYQSVGYIEPRLHGVLDNGNGTEVAAISLFRAGASVGYEEFKILRYSDRPSSPNIISGFHHEMSTPTPESYTVNEELQKITINEAYGTVSYKLKDNFLIHDDGHKTRLFTGKPITTNQKFIDLLDNTYFKSGTYFGDSSFDAEKNDGNLMNKDAHEGGYHSSFEDYSVLYGYEDPTITTIILFGFENLAVSDLEKVIGQPLQIETAYSAYDDMEISFVNFTFDNYKYHAELDSNEHEMIDHLVIYNDLHLE